MEQTEKAFLEDLKYKQVKVFLSSGIAIDGELIEFDVNTLQLLKDGKILMAYKAAIATVIPK